MSTIEPVDGNAQPGKPLQPWTYRNEELFELEYEALFLARWQFVGHANDIPDVGAYLTVDIGRDSVIVIRGKDKRLHQMNPTNDKDVFM